MAWGLQDLILGCLSGQRCRPTPSGRNSFPCSVSSVGIWPPGLQRSGAPTPALVLRAVGVCALTPGHALPRAWKVTLRGQNRAPPLAQTRSLCSGLLPPPVGPAPPGVQLGLVVGLLHMPTGFRGYKRMPQSVQDEVQIRETPWVGQHPRNESEGLSAPPSHPHLFLTRVLVVSPKHVWSLSHSSTSCGSQCIHGSMISLPWQPLPPRLTQPCLFRASPLLCLHPLTILRAQRRGLPGPQKQNVQMVLSINKNGHVHWF